MTQFAGVFRHPRHFAGWDDTVRRLRSSSGRNGRVRTSRAATKTGGFTTGGAATRRPHLLAECRTLQSGSWPCHLSRNCKEKLRWSFCQNRCAFLDQMKGAVQEKPQPPLEKQDAEMQKARKVFDCDGSPPHSKTLTRDSSKPMRTKGAPRCALRFISRSKPNTPSLQIQKWTDVARTASP